MTNGTKSRQKILEQIRRGTGETAESEEVLAAEHAALPRNYVRRGGMTAKQRVERMVERLREYDADVTECAPRELPAVIEARLAASGRRRFVAPAGVPAEWLAKSVDWRIDHQLAMDEIEKADGVVTAAFCGVAESGTIVLHHGAAEGRRVLSLLPDWHLCVLRASQVVETLPEYFGRCQRVPALVTWISGPSATADIEMTRIKGVHGPRFLDVIVVIDEVLEANLN